MSRESGALRAYRCMLLRSGCLRRALAGALRRIGVLQRFQRFSCFRMGTEGCRDTNVFALKVRILASGVRGTAGAGRTEAGLCLVFLSCDQITRSGGPERRGLQRMIFGRLGAGVINRSALNGTGNTALSAAECMKARMWGNWRRGCPPHLCSTPCHGVYVCHILPNFFGSSPLRRPASYSVEVGAVHKIIVDHLADGRATMAKAAGKLTGRLQAVAVKALVAAGQAWRARGRRQPLLLRRRPGAGKWTLRYAIAGKSREMGLAPTTRTARPAYTGAGPRGGGGTTRILRGRDPIAERGRLAAEAKAEADRLAAQAEAQARTFSRTWRRSTPPPIPPAGATPSIARNGPRPSRPMPNRASARCR